MYTADLSKITTDEFAGTIVSAELIPSRRALKDHIEDVAVALKRRDVHDLEALRRLLRDKKRHAKLAPELGVDEGYLVILTREVNAYVTKSLPLARLEVLTDSELERLSGLGLCSTKDLYERAAAKSGRTSLAAKTEIAGNRLLQLLELCDLVRVTGIGPASAPAFREIGIHGPGDYLATDSEAIQARYADWTEEHTGRREVIAVSDIDYCRRYCVALADDIER